MLKIYLARHGQDQDNANGLLNGHRNMPLTEVGVAQAREAALKIQQAGLGFDAIYSSPLDRAFNTAQIIAESVGVEPVAKLDDLIEREYGVMAGAKITDIEKLCTPNILKTSIITYFLTAPGAETFLDVLQRAQRLLGFLKNNHPDGSILLVAHGDIGKMIYTAYYELDWVEVLKQFHFGNSELLLLSPESKPEETHVFTIEQFNH
jgi:probable phosphoglycerate mutase